jgi:serine/threonine protein kinase
MDNLINRKYKINETIGNGKFGIVYKGSNVRTGEIVAIKTESYENPYKLMRRETSILNYLHQKKVEKIPSIYWYGKFMDQICLVMSHYTHDLHTFVTLRNPDIGTINTIMISCIEVMESVHNAGVIHRDIKPQNFMIKNNELFLIDFGLALFYRDEDGNHIDKRNQDTITGTPKYVSYFNHCGEPNSRRDDLISLGYMYLFICAGKLPWDNIAVQCENTNELLLEHPKNVIRRNMKNIMYLREHESDNVCCMSFLELCFNLSFDTHPDYEELCDCFDLDSDSESESDSGESGSS